MFAQERRAIERFERAMRPGLVLVYMYPVGLGDVVLTTKARLLFRFKHLKKLPDLYTVQCMYVKVVDVV